MGNPDLIFIFNGEKVIIILGKDWNNKLEAIKRAMDLYYEWAESEVAWIKTLIMTNGKKGNAKLLDYDIEDMKIYEYVA